MLLMPHKKKIATAILGSMKDKSAEHFVDRGASGGMEVEEVVGPSADDSYAYDSMAADIISAVKAVDAKRLARVLKDFFYQCDSEADAMEGETLGE